MSETDYSLDVDRVSKDFDRPDGGRLTVLNDLSLSLKGPAIVALMGPNGCGKTTLIRIIAGEIPAASGSVVLSGRAVTKTPQHVRARQMGRVHQDSYKSLASDLTVRELLAIAQRRQTRLTLKFPASDNPLCAIEELSKRTATFMMTVQAVAARNLSGGQRQLLALAVAVLGTPQLLLLDEHRASLDEDFKSLADEIVHGLVQRFHTIVLAATHDREWARLNAASLAEMANGQISVHESGTLRATQ